MYGMNSGRPLIILMCLIPFFGAIYIVALNTKRQKTGLWITFSKECMFKVIGEVRPFKITVK
jgi:hypothetical protein